MRKQPRIAASVAAILLSSGIVVADIAATAEPAAAATTPTRRRRVKARRARRPQAPPTAENFARLRDCESGGNYSIATGNGFFGAYQFSPLTWRGLGYLGLPHQAEAAVQDEAASRLWAQRGWQPWPGCSRKLRLR
ncbi:MAG TPA: transglycosylase family protein [Acidimicrobiales bacterium]|jgi:hypothetical protein|nr:transglycosylase family protein [Acidimicrobiales bacterium]